jgi:hypothetical protein
LRKQAVAHDGAVVLNTGRALENRFCFLGESVRSLERGRIRQLDIQIKITLIFARKKSGRKPVPDQKSCACYRAEQERTQSHFSDERARNADISIRRSVEDSVEPPKDTMQETGGLVAWLQKERTERGTQR